MVQKRKIQLFQKLIVYTRLDTSVGRLLVLEYLPIISILVLEYLPKLDTSVGRLLVLEYLPKLDISVERLLVLEYLPIISLN
jgi:hypothetical protein